MESSEEKELPFVRNLDKTTASMTVVDLNNLVVSLRPAVRKAKVAVVHKLVRQMKRLRKLKGTDEQVSSNRGKADRYGLEVDALKKLNVDLLVKNALKNTSPIKNIGNLPDAESRILLRVACQKAMVDSVEKWRSHHEDWKSLAAYLWSKNSGRRYKKTKEDDEKEKKSTKKRKKDKLKPWEKEKKKSDQKNKEIEIQSNLVKVPHQHQRKTSGSTEESDSASDSSSEPPVLKKKTKSVNKLAQESATSKSPTHVHTTLERNVSESKDSDSYSEEDTICADPTAQDSSFEFDNLKNGSISENVISKTDESPDTSEDHSNGHDSGNSVDDDSDSSDDNESQESDLSNHSDSKKVHSAICEESVSTKSMSTKPQLPEMVVKRLNLDSTEDSSEIENQTKDDLPFLFRMENRSKSKTEQPSSTAPKKKRDSFFYGGSDNDDSDSGSSTNNSENMDSDNDNPIVKKQQESTFVGSLSGGMGARSRFSSSYQDKRGGAMNRGTGGFRGGRTSRGSGHAERGRERQGYNNQDRSHLDRKRGGSSYNKDRSDWQTGHSSENRPDSRGARHSGSRDVRQVNKSTDSRKRPGDSTSEVIHPSWAASKKRKEQQAKIQAFQGKKTTFSDDE